MAELGKGLADSANSVGKTPVFKLNSALEAVRRSQPAIRMYELEPPHKWLVDMNPHRNLMSTQGCRRGFGLLGCALPSLGKWLATGVVTLVANNLQA